MSWQRKTAQGKLPSKETLAAVTHALHRLTHLDKSQGLTSGALDAFPLPGLQLHGDAMELSMSLTSHAADAFAHHIHIKTPTDHVYTLTSDKVQVRNPQWLAFVDKILDRIKEPLGIFPRASVYATLKEVVLVRHGGHLPLDGAKCTKDGMFGTLIIALPSDFTGGDVLIYEDATTQLLQWGPRGETSTAYDVEYCAFYNNVELSMGAFTSGEALYLVYDLTTTTIEEVPRFAGASVLQNAVNASLTNYFEPISSAKRFKIGDDVWRIINEYIVEHRFVYPVTGGTFDMLDGTDQLVANQLAAFCAHSGGQYVLYLVGLCCKRKSYSRGYDEFENDEETEFSAILESPWVRFGELSDLRFPSTTVNFTTELAPPGYLERINYEVEVYSDDDDDDEAEIYHRGYGHRSYDYFERRSTTRQHSSHALVVQPATLEHVLWSKLPINEAVSKIHELLQISPHEATRLARRVLSTQPCWKNTDDLFLHVLQMVEALNDEDFFCDLLRTVDSFEFDGQLMVRVVQLFRWETCAAMLKDLMPKLTFRSRVNLICCVVYSSNHPARIDELVEQLIHLHSQPESQEPPTHARYRVYLGSRNANLTIEEFNRLLGLAYRSSTATVAKLLHISKSTATTLDLIVPSLAAFVEGFPVADRAPLLPFVRSCYNNIQSMLPKLRNATYASCVIPAHCDSCELLQSFVTSDNQHVLSIRMKNKAHLKHIETVVKRKITPSAVAVVWPVPPDIVITKSSMQTARSITAERCLRLLRPLLA